MTFFFLGTSGWAGVGVSEPASPPAVAPPSVGGGFSGAGEVGKSDSPAWLP